MNSVQLRNLSRRKCRGFSEIILILVLAGIIITVAGSIFSSGKGKTKEESQSLELKQIQEVCYDKQSYIIYRRDRILPKLTAEGKPQGC